MNRLRHFTCARCGLEYATETTEAEMNREFLASGMIGRGGIASVCDDCYDYVMVRAKVAGLIP